MGLDLSEEAISLAKIKRPGLSFSVADCDTYTPNIKFDVIVFNEMLYYTDHNKIMKRYTKFLSSEGIYVISIWFNNQKFYVKDTIFGGARKLFPENSLGSVEVTGETVTLGVSRSVSFHIEAFKASSLNIVASKGYLDE